jgi:hypothetical protein
MEFLTIKNRVTRPRADGSKLAEAFFVRKPRKFAQPSEVQTVSKKKCLMVTGAHDSGKSRWIHRLYDAAAGMWGQKATDNPPVILEALQPLIAWTEQEGLISWWDKRAEERGDEKKILWKSLKPHQRADGLIEYVAKTGAIVFCDDAHRLTGRKLQVARSCLMAAKIFVISASEEQRIAPNLRQVVLRRDPQIFRLGSEVSYDATNIFMWIFLFGCLAGGWWEAAAVLGGLKALGSGRRATRAD